MSQVSLCTHPLTQTPVEIYMLLFPMHNSQTSSNCRHIWPHISRLSFSCTMNPSTPFIFMHYSRILKGQWLLPKGKLWFSAGTQTSTIFFKKFLKKRVFFGLDGYSYQLRDFTRYVVFILTTSRDIAFIDMFINRRQQGRQADVSGRNDKKLRKQTQIVCHLCHSGGILWWVLIEICCHVSIENALLG